MFKRFSNRFLDEHLLFNLKGPCFDKLYFIVVLITNQISRTVESINLLIKELSSLPAFYRIVIHFL